MRLSFTNPLPRAVRAQFRGTFCLTDAETGEAVDDTLFVVDVHLDPGVRVESLDVRSAHTPAHD